VTVTPVGAPVEVEEPLEGVDEGGLGAPRRPVLEPGEMMPCVLEGTLPEPFVFLANEL
jgi:hypothetical protein